MIQTLSDALSERGYETMTAVQEEVTRPELQNADLLVSAQTGSGKTVAFGLAMAPTLLDGTEALGEAASPLALVIAPTRELAFQVMRELGWLYAKAGGRVVSCVGGMDMREERRALERGAHIVVGTPGRLRDHIQRGSLVMERLRVVVLDEADEMLDMGFREDLEFMLGLAPADRRTLMFSATVPAQIAKLAAQYQRDAVRVTTLSGTRQHADIAYQAVRVAPLDGENAILALDTSPRLLRAGGLPLEALEAALGERIAMDTSPERVAAPGQMASHYAPEGSLRLEALAPEPGEVMLGFGEVPGRLTLSASGDLQEAAANLFGHLHALDAMGAGRISGLSFA